MKIVQFPYFFMFFQFTRLDFANGNLCGPYRMRACLMKVPPHFHYSHIYIYMEKRVWPAVHTPSMDYTDDSFLLSLFLLFPLSPMIVTLPVSPSPTASSTTRVSLHVRHEIPSSHSLIIIIFFKSMQP